MDKFAGIRTYQGSCHCGAVRFEAEIDLGTGTSQCNCSWCSKSGWWGCIVKPSAFRLLAGEENIVRRGTKPQVDRPQCRTCGLAAFDHGNIPEIGGEFYSVNVRCLDGVDLEGVPVKYVDGRHDTWATLATKPYETPFVGAGAPHLKPVWMS